MTASSANSLSRKDGNVSVDFGVSFVLFWPSASSLSEQPLWTWALEGKLTWHCRQFDIIVSYFFDNFVLDKLPKLYKIFVQKQSITCIKNINVHVIYYFFTAYDIWSILWWAKTLFLLFLVKLLTNMKVAHVTLHISFISFSHWNYFSS